MSDIATQLLCPTTGNQCAYREHLSTVYTQEPGVDALSRIPSEFRPELDGAKLYMRLVEHGLAARVLVCAGMDSDNKCPTAETMSANKSRNTARSLVGFLKRK